MYGKSLYRFKEKTTPLLAQLKQQESIRVAKRD
jgi:hypothetical protein